MSDVVRVSLLTSWTDPTSLTELYNRMTTRGSYEWDDDRTGLRLRLVVDDPSPDVWVVLNRPPPSHDPLPDPSRTIVFHMEPVMWTAAMRPIWGRWAAPSPTTFLQVRDHRHHRSVVDWWVGLSHHELVHGAPPEKTHSIGACVSAKYSDPGHRLRVDLLRHLDAQDDLGIDVWGDDVHGFRGARGPTPPHDKRQAILPYRYWVDAENHRSPNFLSEKILDPILAECLPFYWGCPNLDAFLDPEAYIELDMADVEGSTARIREAIAADEWTARLPAIRAMKVRILEELAFFPTLARVIDGHLRPHIAEVEPELRAELAASIGELRAGRFVEVSDRADGPHTSETLDVERAQRWTGLVLEASAERADAARARRDATVTVDTGRPLHEEVARHAIPPRAVDWLNLAVTHPSTWLAAGGRVELEQLRPNLVSLPRADAVERQRAMALLEAAGYDVSASGQIARRPGRHDVFGWYHVWTVNTWAEVVDEQVERLVLHGLTAATRQIFATVTGPEHEAGVARLREAWGDRLVVVHSGADGSAGERPALEHCRWFCAEQEPLAAGAWYLHAKGVSDGRHTSASVTDWRHLLEHVVVDRWRDALGQLDRHDVAGPNWHLDPAPHFSGNAWWARPRYLATLPEQIGPHPLDPELWIGTDQPAVACLHDSGVDHYAERYPPNRYADDR